MKTLLTVPFAVFSFFFAAAQAPTNDDCAGIVDLGEIPYCSQAAQFTNLNATTSVIDATTNIPTCWNNLADRDVWFQFSLPANGSITDLTISIWGNIAGNGTMNMPQLAVYRGDCVLGGLSEIACLAAPLNVNDLHLDLTGLLPGIPYFLRINDYSATGSPNSGTFKLCVGPFVPDVNIGDSPGSTSCSGTLWDSGGPDLDYQNEENETFVICPTEFHQCIQLNFISYATEPDYDFIHIYAGDGITSNLQESINGSGLNLQIQVPSDCATIQFDSDGSIMEAGFQMTWQCSPEICDAPPPVLPSNSNCDQALNINGCDNAPQMIALSPGQGDPTFILDGVNAGCIQNPSPNFNFSFFYFQAAVNGEFGFLVKNANPANPADIDFCVWGPIGNAADICNFVRSNQPVRSSWTFAPDADNPDGWTGLTHTHPFSGAPVLDDFDCGSPATPGQGTLPNDDSFVTPIQVQQGEIYVVLLDNFDGAIENDGIDIDFSGTNDDVLGPITPPIAITNDTFSCSGVPVQLQVDGGVAYAWHPSAGLSCNTCPNPFASPSVTTTYTVQVIDVCRQVTDSVTVFTGPQLDIQHDTLICNGQSVILGQTVPETGATYTWTPNDGSLSDPATANPIATPLQTTVYTVVATNGFCTTTRVVTVAVVNLDMQVSLKDTSICSGASVSIQATTNPVNPINWFPLTQIQVQPGGTAAIASPSSSTTYYVSSSLSGCMRKDTVNIHVDSLPADLTLSPTDIDVCEGTQVLLSSPSYSFTDFPNLQFSWQTSTGQQLPDQQYFYLASPTETTTYQRITTNGVCVDTASANLTLIPVPIISISPAAAQICFGESTPLEVMNASNLSSPQWSPPIGLSCISCTTVTAAPSVTTDYQFSGMIDGCPATATVTVEVNSAPQFEFPNDTICSGEHIVLNLLPDPTVTYSWTSNPAGFSSTAAQPEDTLEQTTTYIVSMENGCSLVKQFTIQVIPPGNLVLVDTVKICSGVSIPLTASGSYPGAYQWSNGATGQVILVEPAQTSTYTVTYNYPLPLAQCQETDSVIVLVQGQVAQVQFPNDVLLCPGDSIMLNAVSTPGASYSWIADPPIFSSQDPIPSIFYPGETATYTVITTLDNCRDTSEVEVTVFNPQMVVSEDTSVCAGEPLTIGADAFLTGDYHWTPGGAIPTFLDTVTTNAQYFLHFEYGEGCIYRDTVNVTVIPNFTIKLVTDPDTNRINIGESILLDAFIPGTNVNNFTFDWLENNANPVGNTQQITVTPVTTDSSVTYQVTVEAPTGCIQTAFVTFGVIQPNVKIPNAFTPNGDGSNDSFGLAIVEGVARVEKMEIYSRWGQKVFASSDPNARWDGTIDGKAAPSDVYGYVIFWREGDGALLVKHGDLTLLR